MSEDADALAKLRHDIANPLGALLTEVQMALFDRATLPASTVESLERMEQIALRMRDLVRRRPE